MPCIITGSHDLQWCMTDIVSVISVPRTVKWMTLWYVHAVKHCRISVKSVSVRECTVKSLYLLSPREKAVLCFQCILKSILHENTMSDLLHTTACLSMITAMQLHQECLHYRLVCNYAYVLYTVVHYITMKC